MSYDGSFTSSELSAYANATMEMTVYEQAYLVSHGITALAPTSTRFGVTLRDLIGRSPYRR